MKEAELVSTAAAEFRERGFLVYEHVRVPPREIDLVLIRPGAILIFAVEAKLRDWRRAAVQACTNLLYADYSAVLLPSSRVQNVEIAALESLGLGLISISTEPPSAAVLLQARRSEEVVRPLRRQLWSKLARKGLDHESHASRGLPYELD